MLFIKQCQQTIIFLFFFVTQDAIEADENKAFYESSEDSSEAETKAKDTPPKKMYVMDPDHRLLLKNTKPLLNSRNGAVRNLLNYFLNFLVKYLFCFILKRFSNFLQECNCSMLCKLLLLFFGECLTIFVLLFAYFFFFFWKLFKIFKECHM